MGGWGQIIGQKKKYKISLIWVPRNGQNTILSYHNGSNIIYRGILVGLELYLESSLVGDTAVISFPLPP